MRCGRHAVRYGRVECAVGNTVRYGRGECAVGEVNVLGSIYYRKVSFSATIDIGV